MNNDLISRSALKENGTVIAIKFYDELSAPERVGLASCSVRINSFAISYHIRAETTKSKSNV